MSRQTQSAQPARGAESAAEVAARIESRLSEALEEIGAALGELPVLAALACRPAPAGVAPRLLNIAQAAEALSLGKSTVNALVASGEIGSVKIGSARRVPVEEIDAYVARLRQKGA
jgi:excisionase family DNA binding protein